MLADQAGSGQIEQAIGQLEPQATVFFEGLDVAAHQGEGRAQPRRLGLDRLQRLGGLAGDDDGAARLDDARLFPGDPGQLRSQHFQVVVVDRGDDAHRRSGEDVGGVEPAAQAHLDDVEIRRGQGEGVEGRS